MMVLPTLHLIPLLTTHSLTHSLIGEVTTVYNELYRWNFDKNEWKLIESLNTPPPRCSHQAVFFKDKLYIFGGEYATLDQFHHYRDLCKTPPSPLTHSLTHL